MHPSPTRVAVVAIAAIASLGLAACGGGDTTTPTTTTSASTSASANTNPLTILIGSSGDAETTAVKAAVAAWSAQSGTEATVKVAADLGQEAAQGFASGKPADILYTSTDQLATWASSGALEAYGDKLANKADFYPSLVSAFTYKDQFYCAPKDFSTLQLVINKKMWDDAGLTEADAPKTWADLATVAKKLHQGKVVGLSFGPELQRVGVFMGQAGGGVMSADGATVTANSPENLKGLTEVKTLLASGDAALSSDLGAGWGGEAFGKGLAAMVIEGNWIKGAMDKDYTGVDYFVAELPADVKQSTLVYTNCWGIATDGMNKDGAINLVQYLTSTDQQLKFADAFGVLPSVKSAADAWTAKNAKMVPFLKGADYGQSLPAFKGSSDAITEFNNSLKTIKTGDPQKMLDTLQSSLTTAQAG